MQSPSILEVLIFLQEGVIHQSGLMPSINGVNELCHNRQHITPLPLEFAKKVEDYARVIGPWVISE